MDFNEMEARVIAFAKEYAARRPGIENPLSGEFADDLTPEMMLTECGITLSDDDDFTAAALCDEFEATYAEAEARLTTLTTVLSIDTTNHNRKERQ